MGEFKMPSLGADMESGILREWKVKPGDLVKRGDILAEIEADKGLAEVESFEDGVIDQLLVEPGGQFPVGTVLATIRNAPEPAATQATPTEPTATTVAAEQERPPEPKPVAQPNGQRPRRISPLARKIAAELGVDPSSVQGSGAGGAIQRIDIERAAAAQAQTAPPPVAQPPVAQPPIAQPPIAQPPIAQPPIAQPPIAQPPIPQPPIAQPPIPQPPIAQPPQAAIQTSPQVEPSPSASRHDRIRRALAAIVTRSNREIPHYHVSTRIDMSASLRWLENLKRPPTEPILPIALLLRAVVLALGEIPELNGFWLNDQHQISPAVHLGLVIAQKEGGLVVPVIRDAHLKNLGETMNAVRTLVPRARSGHLRMTEMSDPTITVNCLGDLNVESITGLIYPPQVALVGFGRITEQPWAEAGMLGVRPVLHATLSGDYRATDGHRGGEFLEALGRNLQQPEKL